MRYALITLAVLAVLGIGAAVYFAWAVRALIEVFTHL